MDDTPKEVQVQLTSDHGLSQLNLGYITRIPDVSGRKDYRGQGFELRTDNWGAIRAAQGMLITTEGRNKGAKHQRDMPETHKRLVEAQQIHKNMGEVAAQNQAMDETHDQIDVSKALEQQNQAIKGSDDATSLPELTAPHIVVASPAGIETTTPESMHLHTGEHIAMTSGNHTSIVSNKSFLVSAVEAVRMFAYKAGMKLIAASGDIDIKALKDNLNAFAKLNITQTANKIIITAKEEVVINGGGSYSKWNGGGIEHGTAGAWVEHAATHLMPGPKSKGTSFPALKPGIVLILYRKLSNRLLVKFCHMDI
jgi:type VI secretion system secreted protein VgrG